MHAHKQTNNQTENRNIDRDKETKTETGSKDSEANVKRVLSKEEVC